MIENALPTAFTERLAQILPPDQLTHVVESFQLIRPTTLRVNTLKTTAQQLTSDLKALHLTPVDWYADAFLLAHDQRQALLSHPIYLKGHCYIQSLSSMLPPLILDPQPGEEILDLTAAPGSKTCQIACLMQNQGRLAAVEKVKKRYFKLKENLDHQGVSIAHTYLKDGAHVWRSCPERFDRVLLDAPCSSEGRFDLNDPKSMQYWSEKKVGEMARKQWRLLYSAFQSLKPGGVLVYSTCTFAPEENELQIAKLIKKFTNQVGIIPIELDFDNQQPGLTTWQDKTLPDSITHTRRVLPNDVMPGFFIAKIKKL